jgi:hypothetical protein
VPSPSPVAAAPTGPRTLSLHLYCGAETDTDKKPLKRGTITTSFEPVEGAPPASPSLEIHWSCLTDPKPVENWAERERERNPSFVGVAPTVAMGSFSTTGGTLGDDSLTYFGYGAQFSAFRTISGYGPVAEYRLTNARYSGGSASRGPVMDLQHSALVGVRLPFFHRLEVEPLFGFASQPFLTGSTMGEAQFAHVWTPQIGGRIRVRAIEMSERASIDLGLGYGHFLSAQNADVSSTGGSAITGQMRVRQFSSDTWGSDWFVEYSTVSRGTESLTQGESVIRVGVSFLIELN